MRETSPRAFFDRTTVMDFFDDHTGERISQLNGDGKCQPCKVWLFQRLPDDGTRAAFVRRRVVQTTVRPVVLLRPRARAEPAPFERYFSKAASANLVSRYHIDQDLSNY
jgi:hypothetical protein